LTENRSKDNPPEKNTSDKKRKNAYTKLWVLLQKGGVMTMVM
jgi:hypothetical protein